LEFRHFISRLLSGTTVAGRLIGSEFEPSKILRARENLVAGGLSDLVEVREGDALETLARDLPDSIDFVLLDGAKNLYSSILSLLESRLRAGALIVADNADSSPEYLARVRSTARGYLSVPFADDVELSMRGAPNRRGAACLTERPFSLSPLAPACTPRRSNMQGLIGMPPFGTVPLTYRRLKIC
jgi:hypothetical protein